MQAIAKPRPLPCDAARKSHIHIVPGSRRRVGDQPSLDERKRMYSQCSGCRRFQREMFHVELQFGEQGFLYKVQYIVIDRWCQQGPLCRQAANLVLPATQGVVGRKARQRLLGLAKVLLHAACQHGRQNGTQAFFYEVQGECLRYIHAWQIHRCVCSSAPAEGCPCVIAFQWKYLRQLLQITFDLALAHLEVTLREHGRQLGHGLS